eukprot:sb/3473992/
MVPYPAGIRNSEFAREPEHFTYKWQAPEMLGLDDSHVAHQIFASEARLIANLERHDKGKLTMYNPLVYACEPHCAYVCKYGNAEKPILFVGMSATPYGMAQNGVPFGNTKHRVQSTTNQNSLFRSRDWLSANHGPVFTDSVGS